MKNNKISQRKNLLLFRYSFFGLFFLLSGLFSAHAQSGSISGKVTDRTGIPLPGVNVLVEGSTVGTITGIDGDYTVQATGRETVISFSFIGYTTQKIKLGNRTVIDVVLEEDAREIDEVVVIGYGTVRKSDLTGSVTSVNVSELAKSPVLGVDQMLQGRVSGLQLTQVDGQPGSKTTIRIRGTNSINSGNEPLYVIDGFAGISDLNTINPNDIQSIEVLKDASATAIYGSRGANGVILVTTKKGAAGRHSINFDAYVGIQKLYNKLDMMNAQEFARYLNDFHSQSNAANPSSAKPLPYDDEDIKNMGAGTDWQDELYRTAPMQNYQLSFSGGTEDTRYYLAFNHSDQQGIMRNTGFRREMMRANLDRKVSDKINIGFSSQLSYSSQDVDATSTGVGYGAAGGALNMSPIVPLRDEDGEYTFQNDPIPYVGIYGNPVAGVTKAEKTVNTFRGLVNFFAEYEIIPHLKLKSSFGVDYSSGTMKNYIPSDIYIGQSTGGSAESKSIVNYSWLNENTLSYNKQLNDKHGLDVLLGLSFQEFQDENFNARTQDFFTDIMGSDNLSIGSKILNPTSNKERSRLASYFFRTNYRLMDKYLFTFTFRSDGSSRFGENNKWGYFPSGAIAWRVKEESFMKDIEQISNLKLRASVGITGNQEIGSYQSLVRYTTNGYSLGKTPGRVVGIYPQNLANPDLSWESTVTYDVGFDLGLFNDRLSFVFDFYHKRTKDLLLQVAVPRSSGYSSILINAGKVQNQGVDISLNSRNIETKDFQWLTTLNYSTNKNKVLDMNGTNDIMVGKTGSYIITNGVAPSILRVGEPIGSFYGYRFKGIWQTQEEIDAAGAKGVSPGDPITSDEREIIGQAAPKFIYSMNNTLTYKNFDLSVFIQGTHGNKVLNVTKYGHFSGTMNNQLKEVVNAWNGPGTSNTIPRAYSTGRKGVLSNYLEDGSYLRIQTVSLAYNIPIPKSAKVFKSASVYFTAQNLYTFTDYSGYTPEISAYGTDNLSLGIDLNSYPQSRSYIFGVKLGF